MSYNKQRFGAFAPSPYLRASRYAPSPAKKVPKLISSLATNLRLFLIFFVSSYSSVYLLSDIIISYG